MIAADAERGRTAAAEIAADAERAAPRMRWAAARAREREAHRAASQLTAAEIAEIDDERRAFFRARALSSALHWSAYWCAGIARPLLIWRVLPDGAIRGDGGRLQPGALADPLSAATANGPTGEYGPVMRGWLAEHYFLPRAAVVLLSAAADRPGTDPAAAHGCRGDTADPGDISLVRAALLQALGLPIPDGEAADLATVAERAYTEARERAAEANRLAAEAKQLAADADSHLRATEADYRATTASLLAGLVEEVERVAARVIREATAEPGTDPPV